MAADEDTLLDLCKFAKEKLMRALVSVPDSYRTLFMLAKTENWLGKKWQPQDDKSTRQFLFSSAERHVRDALKVIMKKRQFQTDHELFELENEMKDLLNMISKDKASSLKKSSGNNNKMISSMLPTTQSSREKEQGGTSYREK